MELSSPGIYPGLAGRTAIVTGGSKGIGFSTAVQLAANDVRVALVARTKDAVEDAVEGLREGGATAHGVAADCTDGSALASMVEEVTAALGPPDIVMAFAG